MSTLLAFLAALAGRIVKAWCGEQTARQAHRDVGRLEAEVATRETIREIRDEVQEAGARPRGDAHDVARRLRARAERARRERDG